MDDDEWADTLGDREAVEQAYQITVHSLNRATEAIHQDELQQARKQGLLSTQETQAFIQHKRQQEMQTLRTQQQSSAVSEHRQKQ